MNEHHPKDPLETVSLSISHALNNALGLLTGHLALLTEAAGAESEQVRLWGARAERGIERIQRISRALRYLDSSTHEPQPGEILGQVDLNTVLKQTLELVSVAISSRAVARLTFGQIPLLRLKEERVGKFFLDLILAALNAASESNPAAQVFRVETSQDPMGWIRVVISLWSTLSVTRPPYGHYGATFGEQAAFCGAEFHWKLQEPGGVLFEVQFPTLPNYP